MALAEELSPDTYLNIMGQYHPEYEVNTVAKSRTVKYREIGRPPTDNEMVSARQAAHDAGLWRFDSRWLP